MRLTHAANNLRVAHEVLREYRKERGITRTDYVVYTFYGTDQTEQKLIEEYQLKLRNLIQAALDAPFA